MNVIGLADLGAQEERRRQVGDGYLLPVVAEAQLAVKVLRLCRAGGGSDERQEVERTHRRAVN